MSDSTRFKDAGQPLEAFADEFLVECPRCSKLCKVTISSVKASEMVYPIFSPRKATCFSCGFSKEWTGGPVIYRDGYDWYFGFSLWLKVPCCSKIIWAFNERHLEFLEDYVKARQREQLPNANRSLISRLPAWIKSGKNRPDVLKCLKALRRKLEDS